MWSLLRGGHMRFDRCAGGHNFDFDTDVCTRCGIDRRQYLGGGNRECVPRPIGVNRDNNSYRAHPADLDPMFTSNGP
jgi:hypothetical protein